MLFKICGLFILGARKLPWVEFSIERPSDAEQVAQRAERPDQREPTQRSK